MADDAGEKTEAPTAKKKSEARNDGNIAKSQDLVSGFMLFLATIAIYIFGNSLYKQLKQHMVEVFEKIPEFVLNDSNFIALMRDNATFMLQIMIPILFTMMFGGVLINFMQVGLLWSTKSITPNFSTVFAAKGIKNVVGVQAYVELLKGIFKMGIVGWISYWVISGSYEEMIPLTDSEVGVVVDFIFDLVFQVMIYVAMLLIILGILDYVYQKYKHGEKMKMSKQEVKDESKQMDGDLQMKQKMRQAMMEMAKKGMMAEVPTATVVVTNPTYIAIAIRYIRGDNESPVVVAKGKRKIAQQIRDLAEDNTIPVIQNIPLARGMYDLVEPGQDIPAEFFTAVAEILAIVYKDQANKY